jgi:hypothetical protein
MTGLCCRGEGRSRPLARRLSAAAGSVMPGAALVLLPKCPLCLAAWLTAVTGVAIPAAAAATMRWGIAALWVAAVALAARRILRHRGIPNS